jgi:hypothetical protein
MAAITLSEAFGSTATLNAGVLTVNLTDFTTHGLDGANPTPSEILTAILLRLIAVQPSNAVDDIERGVVIGTPFKTFSRNEAQLEYQYPFSVYVPITLPELDPDNVVG